MTGVVCSPHHLASEAGARVLESGGNALDAAVAANLTLGVVAPYFCGPGGDLFALVWDGALHGYCGAGRAPADAALNAIRERSPTRPVTGPLTITVPGAVRGWFDLLERFGSRPFWELAADAIEKARFGFTPTSAGARRLRGHLLMYPEAQALHDAFGHAETGQKLIQAETANVLETIARDGPAAFYDGAVTSAIVEAVRDEGGLLAHADLAAHRGAWVDPMRVAFRNHEVVELPPPSQGVAALEALRILDDAVIEPGLDRIHRMIEASKLALADRDHHVADPARMLLDPETLVTDGWVEKRRHAIDPQRARHPAPGVAHDGGTAYLCSADGNGMLVSLIQSNFWSYGSGVRASGITLQNRGASFVLEPGHPNAWAPLALPMHTLAPGVVLSCGEPVMVFGTMGGDAQTQVHAQLLTRLFDDEVGLVEALRAPRWRIDPGTWKVTVEPGTADAIVEGLRARGHRVSVGPPDDDTMGHAHLIRTGPTGLEGATDPRCEGRAIRV